MYIAVCALLVRLVVLVITSVCNVLAMSANRAQGACAIKAETFTCSSLDLNPSFCYYSPELHVHVCMIINMYSGVKVQWVWCALFGISMYTYLMCTFTMYGRMYAKICSTPHFSGAPSACASSVCQALASLHEMPWNEAKKNVELAETT